MLFFFIKSFSGILFYLDIYSESFYFGRNVISFDFYIAGFSPFSLDWFNNYNNDSLSFLFGSISSSLLFDYYSSSLVDAS